MVGFFSKTIFSSFRVRGGKTVLLPRYLLMLLLFLLVLVPVFPAAGAEEEVPQGMALRWMNYFYMAVPSDWKPMMDRDGVRYFMGVHPDAMDDPASVGIPSVALGVTRQKAPKGGDYRAFFGDMEKMAARDNTKNFSSKEEETFIGERPAMFYSFSAEVDMKGSARMMGGNVVVGKEPDKEGMFTLVMVVGSSASVDKYSGVIRTILASAKEGAAPLGKAASFPFGATEESFRHSEGPFAAADGTIAVLDRFGKRIRLFDPAGVLVDEWGTKGNGEDGTFAWPTVIAFAPDGSLYVADEGYSVDANIQHFSRKGEFLGKIKADKKSIGEKGIYKPQFLAVTETGKIVTLGSTEISSGKPRVLVFSPEGKLLTFWDLESVKQVALLPGEKIVMSKIQAENVRADKFAVYDLEGKLLKEWPFWGTDLPPTPGDDKIYFRPEYLGADSEGRIYAYDDSDYGIWIYDPDGRFLQVVPARETFGLIEGMAVLPNGDVIVKDRPSGYGPGEPSIHRMKNAFPAKILPPAVKTVPGEMAVEAPLLKTPESEALSVETHKKSGLEAELAMLKKALSLREEAASLEEGGDIAGAAAKYRESLGFHDDPAAKQYAEGLERRAALPPPPVKEKEEEPGEELKPEFKPEPSPSKEAAGLDARQRAEALWNKAGELQKAKKYDEALELYRKGLDLTPDDAVQLHAARLELVIPKAKAKAEALWRQAGELQKAKKYDEALRKYREGLDTYYNGIVEEHVHKLDAFIKKQKKQL